MQITSRLHWIRGTASNIYVWIGDSGLMLIDSGLPRDKGKITGYLRQIGFVPKDIAAILITHADYDHAGSTAALQSASKASVYGGEETCSLLASGQSPHHLPRLVELLTRPISGYTPVSESALKVLQDGEKIGGFEDWTAIFTPGHSPDHYAYFSQVNGIAFAGDALFCRSTGLSLGRRFMTGNRELARSSAKQLLELAPALICCGHGPPKSDQAADALMLQSKELDKISQTKQQDNP